MSAGYTHGNEQKLRSLKLWTKILEKPRKYNMFLLQFRRKNFCASMKNYPLYFHTVSALKKVPNTADTCRHLQPSMPLPPQERGKYDSNCVIHHIRLLANGNAEHAFATITTVAKSGDAKIGKTITYSTQEKLEVNKALVTDASKIGKNKTATNIKTRLEYKGYHIESNLKSKDLKWRENIVLQLTPLRFFVNRLKLFVIFSWFSKLCCKTKCIQERILNFMERHKIFVILLEIVAWLWKCHRMSQSGINLSSFCNLCKKYDLPKLFFCKTTFWPDQLRITCFSEQNALPIWYIMAILENQRQVFGVQVGLLVNPR